MKKIMLIYPPGELYQRGEDRCQLNIEESSANAMRACNDLGYASAILKKRGYSIFLKDYPSEKLGIKDLLSDIEKQMPDVVFISTTNATVFSDIEVVRKIKKTKNDIILILKGALFFECNDSLLSKIDIELVDYLIGGEEEFIIGDLIDFHFKSPQDIKSLPFVIYKKENQFIKTDVKKFFDDIDSIPFPDREEMNNDLYIIPDTGEKLATIATSRGCPSSCIYCLSPIISGKKVRFRSVQNILQELRECFFKFKIRNFFFKSDTFTINNKWVTELCNAILNSDLKGKIRWAANSRTDTVNLKMFKLMKKAGCYMVAFGLESGSDESLLKMKKNTTVKQNFEAVKMAKKAGLQTFGFYIIGFPWEDSSHFELTKNAMFKNDTDFIELHIATPFEGTEFFNELKNQNIISDEIYGKNHFECIKNDLYGIKRDEVEQFRKNTVFRYYTRPSYILKKIIRNIFNLKILCNYFIYGIRLIKNFLKH